MPVYNAPLPPWILNVLREPFVRIGMLKRCATEITGGRCCFEADHEGAHELETKPEPMSLKQGCLK